MDNKIGIAAVALASLVVGTARGGYIAHSTRTTGQSDPVRQRNDLVAGYGLLWSTLEDEAQVYKLGC